MFRRIGHIEPAGDDGDGLSCPQRAGMGGGVDAAREAGDHHQARRQFCAEAFREPQAVGRSVARPDHALRTSGEGFYIPQHRNGRRGVGQLRQERRITGTVKEKKFAAHARHGAEFGFHRRDGRDRRRRSPPPARASSGSAASASRGVANRAISRR